MVNDYDPTRVGDLNRVGLGSRDYAGFRVCELPEHALSALARGENELLDPPLQLGEVAQHLNKESGPIAADWKAPIDDNFSHHCISAGCLHTAAAFGSHGGESSKTTNEKEGQRR